LLDEIENQTLSAGTHGHMHIHIQQNEDARLPIHFLLPDKPHYMILMSIQSTQNFHHNNVRQFHDSEVIF